jgi:hypothetical protein
VIQSIDAVIEPAAFVACRMRSVQIAGDDPNESYKPHLNKRARVVPAPVWPKGNSVLVRWGIQKPPCCRDIDN